ncbi:MAG: sulfatase-like hydrolase/transferase [Colwellia sp.]|nr:sulfatase-like hydrolase/transferase [Colwellia sp.]
MLIDNNYFILSACSGSSDNAKDDNEIIEVIPPAEDVVEPKKPNLLFIIADVQGLDASAQYSYSSDIPNTPIITKLAEQGITFDHVWATPACTTTKGTLITGQHGN